MSTSRNDDDRDVDSPNDNEIAANARADELAERLRVQTEELEALRKMNEEASQSRQVTMSEGDLSRLLTSLRIQSPTSPQA